MSALGWLVVACALLGAADPATRSAPAEAQTPKERLKAFAAATRRADAESLRGCLYAASPEERRMADAMVEMAVAVGRLRLAAIARFGEENAKAFEGEVPGEAQLRQIDAAEERIEGDRATVLMKREDGRANSVQLQRIDGVWRIPVGPSISGQTPEKIEAELARMAAASKLAREMAEEIAAGRYRTPEEAVAAMKVKAGAM